MRPSGLVPLLLLPLLAGCLQSRVEEIGVGYYRLNAGYETRAELKAALADQQRRADELCPGGWFKRDDYDGTATGASWSGRSPATSSTGPTRSSRSPSEPRRGAFASLPAREPAGRAVQPPAAPTGTAHG